MKDQLVKALVCEERVRVIVNSTTNLCEEARRRHDCWPTASAALGRVLSIGSIMGSMQKSENEKVTIQINGGGPIGTIMVDCFPNGDVRGFVSDPEQFYTYNDTGKLAVGYAVGREGTLKVIKDLGLKKGMLVSVTGTKDIYSGTHEIKDASVTVLDTNVVDLKPLDITTTYKNATSLKDTALTDKLGMLVTIKGVEITDQDLSEKSMYLNFKLAGLTSVYMLLTAP